jgi:microcystin-dependent protein
MGTTPNYALRYPEGPDPANVPLDLNELAHDVDAIVKQQVDALNARIAALESAASVAADRFEPGDLKITGATLGAPWLLCDGAAVSRTTYSVLFQKIGVAYGAGDGATTFNVPDFQGRALVGVGSHGDVNALGRNEGAALGARRPRHRHTVNEAPHTHGGRFFQDNAGAQFNTVDSGGNDNMMPIPAVTTGISVGPQTGSEPTDGPAYETCHVYIRT